MKTNTERIASRILAAALLAGWLTVAVFTAKGILALG